MYRWKVKHADQQREHRAKKKQSMTEEEHLTHRKDNAARLIWIILQYPNLCGKECPFVILFIWSYLFRCICSWCKHPWVCYKWLVVFKTKIVNVLKLHNVITCSQRKIIAKTKSCGHFLWVTDGNRDLKKNSHW